MPSQLDVIMEPKITRTGSDNLRQLKFNLNAVRAEWKFIFRAIYREFKYLWVFQDLVVFALLIIGLAVLVLFILWLVPFILFLSELILPGVFLTDPTVVPGNPQTWPSYNIAVQIHTLIWGSSTFRLLAGGAGIIVFFIRIMMKSEIRKFKDKANARKDVCFIFGETKYAEKLIYQLIFLYGYEEKVCLVHTKPFLWIDKIKGRINTYQIENTEEYEKTNFYETVEFKTTKQVMVLTDDVEKNQNIITNIRGIKPEVPIIVLKQYAPKFLTDETGMIEDPNLIIIDDLEAIINGLIFSLSLDIIWPNLAEIDVPGSFIGATGDQMSSDIPGLKVLRIKRGSRLLSTDNVIQDNDRVVLMISKPFDMKRTNRVVSELPRISKEEKERKKREQKERKHAEKLKKEEEKKKREEEKKKRKTEEMEQKTAKKSEMKGLSAEALRQKKLDEIRERKLSKIKRLNYVTRELTAVEKEVA